MPIEPELRRLYREAPAPDPEARDALRERLVASLPPRRRPRRHRLLGGLLIGAALAGACVVPADYELEVGHRVLIELDAPPPDFDPDAVARWLEQDVAPDELRVMVQKAHRDGASQTLVMALDIVGGDLDSVEQRLTSTFPVLADADIELTEIDGTVHGTFGGMLSRRALGLDLDRGSIEEARERILADLAARGLDGRATIEIEDEQTPEGHRREVRVRVEADTDAPLP